MLKMTFLIKIFYKFVYSIQITVLSIIKFHKTEVLNVMGCKIWFNINSIALLKTPRKVAKEGVKGRGQQGRVATACTKSQSCETHRLLNNFYMLMVEQSDLLKSQLTFSVFVFKMQKQLNWLNQDLELPVLSWTAQHCEWLEETWMALEQQRLLNLFSWLEPHLALICP
jgi:hypothetical protein